MTFQKLFGVNVLLSSSLRVPLYMLVVTMYVKLGSQEMLVQKWRLASSLFWLLKRLLASVYCIE